MIRNVDGHVPEEIKTAIDTARLGALYAGALASMKLRDFDQARRIADSALSLARAHFADEAAALRDLNLLNLEIEVAMNRPDQPLATALAPLAKDDSRPVLLARADAGGPGDTVPNGLDDSC